MVVDNLMTFIEVIDTTGQGASQSLRLIPVTTAYKYRASGTRH